MSTVTPDNAYRYSDTYTIQTQAEPHVVKGCEHNLSEAKALAKYLTTETGQIHVVVTNSRSDVQAAKEFRSEPLRYEFRDEAFKAMRII